MSEDVQLLEPEEFTVNTGKDESARSITVILSKIPAIPGRRIVTQYPITGAPKLGNYEENEKLMYDLLSYVAIKQETGVKIRLSTPELINNHLYNAEALLRVEKAMLEYNFSFFELGEISASLKNIVQIAPEKITSILTGLLGQFLTASKQNSTNSKPSTH